MGLKPIVKWFASRTDKQYTLTILVGLAILLVARLIVHDFEAVSCYDTPSYIAAIDNIIRGEIDVFRTPVYPMLCYITNCNGVALAIINLVFHVIASLLIYKIVKEYSNSSFAAFIAAAMFCWNPHIISWIFVIMTDSLGASFSAIIIYMYCKAFKTDDVINKALLPPVLIFSVFLRPFFVCFIPLLIFQCIYLLIKKFKHKCTYLATFALSLSLMLGYCHCFKQKYNVFNLSHVSTLNYVDIYIKMGLMEFEISPEVLAENSKRLIHYPINNKTIQKNVSFYQDQVNEVRRNNKVRIIKNHILALAMTSCRTLTQTPDGYLWYIHSLFTVRLMQVYVFIFIYLLFVIIFHKSLRNINVHIALIYICIATVGTSLINNNLQSARLLMPMLPALCIMFGLTVNKFCKRLFYRELHEIQSNDNCTETE